MNMHKRDILDLRIDKMAFGGRGISRVDGFVIFVKGGIPGDRLKAQIIKKKKDYAEARILEVIETSPDRTQAQCPYSGYCGGCQWQHVHYQRQLEYKKEQVAEAMKHIGGLQEAVVHDVIPSENTLTYRNKMEFSFSDRRWFLPHELEERETEGGFALGLHVPGTYNKVIDIEACLLQRDKGNEILRAVKEYVKQSGVPVYGLKTHKGFWRFLAIRHSTAFDEWMVNLVTSEEKPEMVQPMADVLVSKMGQITSVVNNINRRKASIAMGEREILLSGRNRIVDRIGPFIFQVSANSFFQTNSLGAEKLCQTAAEYGELKGNEVVLDLYSGTGTIAIFLSPLVRAVTGIEISESAILDAARNCKENGINNCHFICGDIREKLPDINHKPDILIIDPPRAGMHKDVLSHILAMSPQRIIYVSCNPATMARDIGQMKQYYEVVEIQPVDMFPHTFHIETVVKLWRRKNGVKKCRSFDQ